MKKIYLATPYSHKDPVVREQRFLVVNKFAGELMKEGYVVFSPISHSHPISLCLGNSNSLNHDFWLAQDETFLDWCDEMFILKQEGWEKSKGLQFEIDYIKNLKKSIKYYVQNRETGENEFEKPRCPHGRPNPQSCPHCMGLNFPKNN